MTTRRFRQPGIHRKMSCMVAMLVCGLFATGRALQQDSCADSPVAQVINHMSQVLTTQIGGTDNLFFSPLSVSLVLGMVYLGTRGSTAEQMRQLLHYDLLPGDDEAVHERFQSLMSTVVSGTDQYTLLMANGMFPLVGFELLPEFQSKLASYYSAQSEPLDFAHDGAAAVNHLNSWVSNRTNGKIRQLFDSPLDQDTLLMLCSSIYFKGLWEVAFDERLTYPRDFHNADGSLTRTPFMEFKQKVKFAFVRDYSFLNLKYRGGRISMLLALPASGPPDIQMTSDLLCELRSRLRTATVEVYLPRFNLSYSRELSDDLKALGLSDLFSRDSRADLTGMRQQDDLFLSMFVHGAVIEVNERGSEAAAVSSVAFYARSGFRSQEFVADRPFAFYIVDWSAGAILFTGRVSQL